MKIRLFDVATAAALAQILPVLLLALLVELRRTEIHRRGRSRRRTRAYLGVFFTAFAIIETVMVLSLDGQVYPFQWADLVAALVIFGLLWLIFALSLAEERRIPDNRKDEGL